jgi:hypothetical protein
MTSSAGSEPGHDITTANKKHPSRGDSAGAGHADAGPPSLAAKREMAESVCLALLFGRDRSRRNRDQIANESDDFRLPDIVMSADQLLVDLDI